jgi:hypothetical protein
VIDSTEWLADLIRRVPILAVDVPAAQRAGDHAALAYAEAVDMWRAEAALAIAEADQSPVDAFVRAATASELMRQLAAE